MSEPDFRKMGDPMNDRLPPNDNLLNRRRRRKDLARIVGPRTLDGENVCTRCGVPDVHCQCDDRIDYDAQFDEGTARDDYDIRPIWASDRLGQIIDQHHAMCDEIDHLRAESAAFRDLAGCCSDCEWEGVEIVHRPMCARWQSAEIAEVADRIANGHATCGATWRDTEATGWLWYCSLPVGHAGHHRCVGASW